jgi:hypothetical protein
MSRLKTNAGARLIAAIAGGVMCGGSLGGCSDLYTDHRDKIGLSAGDAIAANEITEMVDPWPRQSANRNIAFNGQKMQSAVERYRTNRVVPPLNIYNSALESFHGSDTAPTPGPSNSSGGAPPAGGAPAQ